MSQSDAPILTRYRIRNLIWEVIGNGGTVSRVVVAWSEWPGLLEDFLDSSEVISPTLILTWNVPVQPGHLPPGDRVRTEP